MLNVKDTMKKLFISLSLLLSSLSNLASASNLISALELANLLPKSKAQKQPPPHFIINKKPSLKDKITGIWLLGAYGDAQARVTEFITHIATLEKQRPDITTQNGYPEIPHIILLKSDKPYARFTDDTHMSLYLTHALLESSNNPIEAKLDAITNNFIHWLQADQTERAPGIAAQNNSAELEHLKNSGAAGINLWSRGNLDSLDISQPNLGLRKTVLNKEGGSGAVMRTAPVSIMFHDQPEFAEQLAVAQGILTHTDSGSRAACAGFNAAMIAALHEQSIETIWQQAIAAAQKYDSRGYVQSYDPKIYHYGSGHFSKNGCAAMCQKAQEYFEDGFAQKPYSEVLDEFRGWGATEALAASLYIFATWNYDPYLAMTIAINRTPGDSDTIAIMVGELLGAQYGYENIAKNFSQHGMDLKAEIQDLETIEDLTEYPQHFPVFAQSNIRIFQELADIMSNPTKIKGNSHAKAKQPQHTPEFILTIGDMMMLPVDCIVNAANSHIQGGGGVDGIITANQKPQGGEYNPPVGDVWPDDENNPGQKKPGIILQELKVLKDKHPAPIETSGLLPEGQAIITSSGTIINQNAKTIKFVIATVGPKGPADSTKDTILKNAYYNSLLLAANVNNDATRLLNIISPLLAQNYQAKPIRSVAFPSISTGIFHYDFNHAAPMAISGIVKAMQEHPHAFDVVHLVIHPGDVKKGPYNDYAMEIQKSEYTKMLHDPKIASPVALTIQKENGGKQVIYRPA